MITTVLWDFGGVFTSSPFEAFNRYEAEQGLPQDFIRSINATNPDSNAWALFERNEISLDAFDTAFADESAAAGHRVPGRAIIPLLAGQLRPRMVAALERIRQDYRVACLTNNVQGGGKGPGMASSSTQAAEVANVMALFEQVFESSKLGCRKPDPQFYTLVCEAMNIEPHQALFLDDLGVNLKPAKAMGMTTIKVSSEAQALADLASSLALVLD